LFPSSKREQFELTTLGTPLLDGAVVTSRALSRYATVNPADLGEGRILLCSVTPTQDVVVMPEGPWEIQRE